MLPTEKRLLVQARVRMLLKEVCSFRQPLLHAQYPQ
jgi:hypothetical protein